MSSPWKKGITSDYKSFVIEVHIKESKEGIQTARNLQDKTDELVVEKLPNQGLEHASFGLMQEAMRQEALFQGLVLLTEKGKIDREGLKNALTETFLRMWDSLSESVVNLTIESISQ